LHAATHLCSKTMRSWNSQSWRGDKQKMNERKRLKRLFDKATAMVEQSTKKKTKKR
jgi:hypothetical protein